jgi:hypothetical protein
MVASGWDRMTGPESSVGWPPTEPGFEQSAPSTNIAIDKVKKAKERKQFVVNIQRAPELGKQAQWLAL